MNTSDYYVALDRDGTIIEDKHYLSDPDQVVLLPGAVKALARLQKAGFVLFVVTNQSGIGRGYFSVDDMHRVNQRLDALLREQGVKVRGYFFCPHRPDDGCGCRKPKPGLINAACGELGLDPAKGFVIGDNSSDIGLGLSVGAATILVRTGHGREHEVRKECNPDFTGDDLVQAADFIEEKISKAMLD